MKIECDLEKIKDAVFKAERITGKNLTLPILSSILVSVGAKTLKMRAVNLSLGIEIELPAKVEKEGTMALSGAVFAGTLSNIPNQDKVVLEEVNGNMLVKTKRSQIKIKGNSFDDFPTIPSVEGDKFEIEAKKLVDGIRSVYYSSSPSDIKPEISSVYIYTQESNLVFAATDSFRLAEKTIKVKGLPEIKGILIPFKNVSEIIRILSEISGQVTVCFNKNQISFSANGIYLTSRVIDGVFPDYRQIVPKAFKTEVVMLKEDLLNALKLSNIFSDKFNQLNLNLESKTKKIELSSENASVGENKTAIDGVLKGEDVSVSFNYKYFLDCFQSIGTDSLTIKLNGATSPMLVSPVGDTSFMYLIMPMNR